MTETLISSLSQLAHLSVKARSTVFRYKGKATDAKTIGKEFKRASDPELAGGATRRPINVKFGID